MAANITIGILAHVDAGKTTLTESILFKTGMIRSLGRVDHQDAFLDTEALEKKRGITIFSKMARFSAGEQNVTLLDTPGHVDFSPEMERTLRVLDYAVLVISAPDIINQKMLDPQVRVLIKLLQHYQVPFFIFVNKMDQLDRELLGPGNILPVIAGEIPGAVQFDERQLCDENEESVAVCEEELMLRVLDGEHLTDADVSELLKKRALFPVYFGAALNGEGVQALLEGIARYCVPRQYPEQFGAYVYKVSRDGAVRLAWMKITGGELKIRDEIAQIPRVQPVRAAGGQAPASGDPDDDGDDLTAEPVSAGVIKEKISGIRQYSGVKFTALTSAQAGDIVAVSGLSVVQIGDGLGAEASVREEMVSPIMTCSVTAEQGVDEFTLMQALRTLEEEEPMLHVSRDDLSGAITVQIMGDVQTQILRNIIQERFGFQVNFGPARIVYKETIRKSVEGVGHFEPLRHYAEVHLLLEPTGPGSGLTFENRCPAGMLDKNWQNLIMTHLREKVHRGVLTGAELTDMCISLIGGRASIKHTEGGDFRRATYRAVRQGLMMAQNMLLEPVLNFRLELPQNNLGRALSDIDSMRGSVQAPDFDGDTAIVEGCVPASTLGSYAQDVVSYTGGRGQLSVSLKDYEPCHNAKEIIDASGYDPDADRRNPSYSVFCSHGAGTVVTWQNVRSHMHVETGWEPSPEEEETALAGDYFVFAAPEIEEIPEDLNQPAGSSEAQAVNLRAQKEDSYEVRERAFAVQEKELERIFEQTYGPVKRNIRNPENERLDALMEAYEPKEPGPGDPKYEKKNKAPEKMEEYLLVDGYNIIFAWNELHDMALRDIKAARDRLLDILSNYAGYIDQTVIVVFDAYKVVGGRGEVYRYHNIDVVYTKEAETADLYIEKTAHTLSKKHRVYVATSDAVEQVIIFSSGAYRISARGLLEQILLTEQRMREQYHFGE